MLEAMNAGMPGSMCTLHAGSAAEAFERLVTAAMKAAGAGWSDSFVTRLAAQGIDYVVHMRHATIPDGRRTRFVSEVAEVSSVGESGGVAMNRIFAPTCERPDGRCSSCCRRTGARSRKPGLISASSAHGAWSAMTLVGDGCRQWPSRASWSVSSSPSAASDATPLSPARRPPSAASTVAPDGRRRTGVRAERRRSGCSVRGGLRRCGGDRVARRRARDRRRDRVWLPWLLGSARCRRQRIATLEALETLVPTDGRHPRRGRRDRPRAGDRHICGAGSTNRSRPRSRRLARRLAARSA